MSTLSINKNTCTKCKKCEKDCVSQAIHIDSYSIASSCIHCGHCIAICETSSMQLNNTIPTKAYKSTITPEDFYNLSTQTRSCRNFKEKTIEDDIIQKLVANMANYPSASNTRQVEVTVVTNKDVIKEINDSVASHLSRMFKLVSKPGIKQIFSLLYGSKEVEKIIKYRNSFDAKISAEIDNITYQCPAIFIFHSPKKPAGMLQADADIWATYTSLYASTFGLGSCFNGFIVKGLTKKCKTRERISIPKSHIIYNSILLGYPKFEYTNETNREIPKHMIV